MVDVRAVQGAGLLIVELATDQPVSVVREHLDRAAGWLRAQVATFINRKRVPELTFVIMAVSREKGAEA